MHVRVMRFEPFFALLGGAAEFTVLLATVARLARSMSAFLQKHPLCGSYLLLGGGCTLRKRHSSVILYVLAAGRGCRSERQTAAVNDLFRLSQRCCIGVGHD